MITPLTPATTHTIPITLTARADGFTLECDVSGIIATVTDGKMHIELPKPAKGQTNHQFCYVVADPAATPTTVYYAAVYSGPSLEKLTQWPRQDGVSRSPAVSAVTAEKGLVFVATVLAAPRLSSQSPAINGPSLDIAAAPEVYTARRRVKTDFQHGGEDIT